MIYLIIHYLYAIPTILLYLSYVTTFIVLLGLGLIYTFQCKLIYPAEFPENSRTEVALPSDHNMPHFEDLSLRTRDNVKIKAYFIKQETDEQTSKACTLLYFHANAGNMVGEWAIRLPIAHIFYKMFKCNVFMVSYRGYGLSEGAPREKGLRLDAQAALDFITDHPLLMNTKIIAFGQSIGGAVAIDLVARNEDKIHAMILENTFLSLPKLIPSLMPFLRHVAFLCHQKWNSEKAIESITKTPILFLSGKRDELVPPQHMKALHEKVKTSGGKSFSEFNSTHNDTCLAPNYFDVIAQFWVTYVDDSFVKTGE
ncbi:alpha/beta-hydrolase [Basidiobolus meristosporus CBS 931.73]|uniref:Alpha/beta-hydrolase n=1 Tax=Basidiobolus meristosporus CBS 931.73 TaxID=1314790 RepID=A0A1Y1XET6_9FUNG|nr:alpha/beta-hydrolase [Basidiobolus meristosporus CBS 931.73]|eukprot:ORX84202.1 alpha/beta-hydrolase [Basidiobolus meristosporus CBS 931.73]